MTELDKHAHRVIKIGIAGASETGRCGVDALETAKSLGEEMAKKAIALKVEKIVFDRGGFIYTGAVKALADGARAGGLKF